MAGLFGVELKVEGLLSLPTNTKVYKIEIGETCRQIGEIDYCGIKLMIHG